MMPVVTVPSSPSGEPMATTSWPTRRLAEEPTVIGVKPDAPCGADHRDVATRVGADDGECRGAAVGEGHLRLGARRCHRVASLAAAHDVVVGQDQAVGGQDDPGALFGLPPEVDLQLDHAGHHLGRDLLDRCRRAGWRRARWAPDR